MNIINYLIIFTSALSTLALLFKRDYNIKSISLFYILFILLVVLSESIFGIGFTNSRIFSENALQEIEIILSLFVLLFLVFSIHSEVVDFDIKLNTRQNLGLLIIFLLPGLIFLAYYATVFGFRLDGSFMLDKDNRSSLDYYIYVYIVSIYIASAYNKSVGLLMIFYSIAYIMAGERMKGYLYVLTLLIAQFRINKSNFYSVFILLSGFLFAEIMSYLRSGLNIGQLPDDINISHFGEVTVSSMFMLEEVKYFDLIQKLKYIAGIAIGNILPSEWLPESMDIRRFIFNASNIPGGGWLPVFLYSASSVSFLAFFAMALGLLYTKTVKKINRKPESSIRKRALLSGYIVFTVTLPNWLMYTPYQVFKMPLYAFVGTYVFSILLASNPIRHVSMAVSSQGNEDQQ